MSASQEKKLRATQRSDGTEKKSAAASEQEQKNRKYRRNVVIVIAVLVVLVVGALVINSDLFYTKTTAITVGDVRYSPAEVSYFYQSTFNRIYQNLSDQLGSMVSMMVDTTKPLKDQEYPYEEGKTWADAIMDITKEDIRRVTTLSETAKAAGRTLSDTDRASIDDSLAYMKQVAQSGGYPDLDHFLAAYYGKGMDEKLFTQLQERVSLASAYETELRDGLTYTEQELADYYAAHAEEYDYYAFLVYSVYASNDKFDAYEGDAKREQVHAAAEALCRGDTPESFIEAVKEFAGENTSIGISKYPAGSIGSAYRDFVTDPARQPGDTMVVDTDDVSYAVMFVEHDTNDYNTVDFRHILFRCEPEEDGTYSETTLAATKEKAEIMLQMWETDPTEDNFAALANANTDDEGSNTNGGLYQQVQKYTMVPGVDDFLFRSGKTAGDVGIVFGQSSAYAGYHLMYYVGENERSCDLMAKNGKQKEDYDALYATLSAPYELSEGSGMRFVKQN